MWSTIKRWSIWPGHIWWSYRCSFRVDISILKIAGIISRRNVSPVITGLNCSFFGQICPWRFLFLLYSPFFVSVCVRTFFLRRSGWWAICSVWQKCLWKLNYLVWWKYSFVLLSTYKDIEKLLWSERGPISPKVFLRKKPGDIYTFGDIKTKIKLFF